MKITVDECYPFEKLNEQIRQSRDKEIEVNGCMGQRYIGSGLSGKHITISGIPGNALGAYLDGCEIVVHGNAQDATGDTMNDGSIVVHGSCGDATGYAMRGGRILVEGDAGYRTGIHMKAYKDKVPVVVIGGRVGSFLGEYQAGGLLVVLDLYEEKRPFQSNFMATGMYGGKIFLRCDKLPEGLPTQVLGRQADKADMDEIAPHLDAFAKAFGVSKKKLKEKPFFVLTPDTANPYHQMYTPN